MTERNLGEDDNESMEINKETKKEDLILSDSYILYYSNILENDMVQEMMIRKNIQSILFLGFVQMEQLWRITINLLLKRIQ